MRPPPTLGAFVVRTFVCLPPCFAAWYFCAKPLAALAGWGAHWLAGLFNSGIISAVEQPGVDLLFVTTLRVYPSPGQAAVLVPEVNSLLYTYGLALFVALMLAGRASWGKILAGSLALAFFQAWGVAFDFLVQIGVKSGADIALQVGLSGWRVEAIALGYQLGVLIFPTLMPVVLWGAFNRPFIDGISRLQVPADRAQTAR